MGLWERMDSRVTLIFWLEQLGNWGWHLPRWKTLKKHYYKGRKSRDLKTPSLIFLLIPDVDIELALNSQVSLEFNRDATTGDNNLGVPVSDVL